MKRNHIQMMFLSHSVEASVPDPTMALAWVSVGVLWQWVILSTMLSKLAMGSGWEATCMGISQHLASWVETLWGLTTSHALAVNQGHH